MEQHPLGQYGPLPIPGTPLAFTRPIRGIVIALPASLLAWFVLIVGANFLFESVRAEESVVTGAWTDESLLVARGTVRQTRLAGRDALLRFGQSARPAE